MTVYWTCPNCDEEFSAEHGIHIYCQDCRAAITVEEDILRAEGYVSPTHCPHCNFSNLLSKLKNDVVNFRCASCNTQWSTRELITALHDEEDLACVMAMEEADTDEQV